MLFLALKSADNSILEDDKVTGRAKLIEINERRRVAENGNFL